MIKSKFIAAMIAAAACLSLLSVAPATAKGRPPCSAPFGEKLLAGGCSDESGQPTYTQMKDRNHNRDARSSSTGKRSVN